MTEQELKEAVEEKGFTYTEDNTFGEDMGIQVFAIKGRKKRHLGTKEVLMEISLEDWKRSYGYRYQLRP